MNHKIMKKIVVFLGICFLSSGCKKQNDIYSCKGIPDENQAFSYMHFKNEKEGYLFGTLTRYQEMSDEDLDNPNFSPQSTDEANIYKTLDGGNSWTKIDSIENSSFYNEATIYDNNIFIKKINVQKDYSNEIIKFDLLKNKKQVLNYNFEQLGNIWNTQKGISTSYKNKGVNSLLYFDKYLNITDSVKLKYVFKNKPLYFKGKNYAVDWDKGLIDLKEGKAILIPLMPECLTSQDSNHILIAGNKKTDDNEIDLLSYDVNTAKSTVIKEFKGYSIVEKLQSNDKVIAGFIGNISGAFTEYDLFYSLDKGKTWKIQKLEEPNYVRPSCLVNNTMYIYSGGARMQKIIFK